MLKLGFAATMSGEPERCQVTWQYLTEEQYADRGESFEQAKADLLRMVTEERDRWQRALDRVAGLTENDIDVEPYDPAWEQEDEPAWEEEED